MAQSEICENCQYWTKTGIEDSGLKAYGSTTENWFYDIGTCSAPPALGNGSGSTNQACWLSCYTFKARRKIRAIEPEELERLRQDIAAATEENADLRARLQTCQELSGGVLPMSDSAVKAGRLFFKDLSSRVDGVGAGYPVNFTLSAGAARRLLDALRPLFGDAGAALKEKK